MARYMITSALPYANGPIHVGHLAGAYLPADIFVRYLKLKGEDVVYICGTDEHGTPITFRALKEGKTPREIVDYYHEQIKETFEKAKIDFDFFGRTEFEVHYRLSQEFFLKLLGNGHLIKRVEKQAYCEHDKMFLPDRYVIGTCPYCGAEGQRGDQCEACGRPLTPELLIDPKCNICGSSITFKNSAHYYIKMQDFEKRIREWIEGNSHWKPNVRNTVLGWVGEGLEERAITRDLNWGIPVPLEEEDMRGKVLYVWFEAPIGYISITIEYFKRLGKDEEWKKYWLNGYDGELKVIHFIGKDNIPFHAIFWPAFLIGYGKYRNGKGEFKWALPHDIPANEYLNLEGRKISTSRNWAIWVHEFLDEFPADYLRYYLTAIMPETRDTDFNFEDFQKKINEELVNNLGNFIHRAMTFVHRYFRGIVPDQGELDDLDRETLERIERVFERVGELLSAYQFKAALKEVMDLANFGNKYFDYKQPWKTAREDKARTGTTINISLQIVKALGVLLGPFLPDASDRIWDMLNLSEKKEWKFRPLGDGHRLNKAKILFKKVDDEQIKNYLKKYFPALLEKYFPEESQKGEKTEGDEKMHVSFDDFAKIDLRVGKIVGVEDHPNADKLYVLRVDLGSEIRQLVAGLKNYYTKEELLGHHVVVITNLEPKKLRGVESQGMLLAADDGERVAILVPDKEVKLGAKIR